MEFRNELSVWNTQRSNSVTNASLLAHAEHVFWTATEELCLLESSIVLSFTWIKCSSAAWSWLLERALTSSCWEGWGRVAGAAWLSWAMADEPLLSFVWVNTLGARSWVGGSVAGIRWGEMTWRFTGFVEELNYSFQKRNFIQTNRISLNRWRKCQNLQEFGITILEFVA